MKKIPIQDILPFYPTIEGRNISNERFAECGVWGTESKQIIVPLKTPFGTIGGNLVRTHSGDPKYVTDPPNAKAFLYNFSMSRTYDKPVILFESPFDVMSVPASIFYVSFALIGVRLSTIALTCLRSMDTNKILLCLDPDPAGKRAAFQLAHKLLAEGFTLHLYNGYLSIIDDYEYWCNRLDAVSSPSVLVL